MTPARKKALQFFHERGEVCVAAWEPERPTSPMVTRLMSAGELQEYEGPHPGAIMQCLTDLGRQRLHEAS